MALAYSCLFLKIIPLNPFFTIGVKLLSLTTTTGLLAENASIKVRPCVSKWDALAITFDKL